MPSANNARLFNLVLPSAALSATDEGWQRLQPEFIKVWASAVKGLQEHNITVGSDKYTVLIDWTNTLRRRKRYYSALQYVYDGGDKKTEFIQRLLKAKYPQRPSQNRIEVRSDGAEVLQHLSIAESAVYDTFLIMNIAVPGCCNFYRASLLGDKIEPNVSLSDHAFEVLLHISLKETWPAVSFLDFGQVAAWYRAVRPSTLQIPSNPMERVLFALFHICKIDMSPIEVIWLFYAFESLLQTSVGQNFSLIVKRLCLLLEANETQSNIIRKRMRQLYDFRSAMVHGGYEVTHPMHDEGLDKRVVDSFVRESQAADYGYALLIAAIQRTIRNGWRYPIFSEAIEGAPV